MRTVDLIRQRFFTLKDFSGQGRAYFADDFEFDDAAVEEEFAEGAAAARLLPALGERSRRSSLRRSRRWRRRCAPSRTRRALRRAC